MGTVSLISAAQYLRTSTDEQRHSLANQCEAIERYAQQHGFVITNSYVDAGRSGLVIGARKALQKMLRELTSGLAGFKAILVYDVSRWGRFQDCDEAAHYEFLCRQCGVTVHYCAEPFANNVTAHSSIIKALKRTMAGEFSRELGERGYAGKRRAVLSGSRPGGPAGYALRRMAITSDGKTRRRLRPGQSKPFPTDQVTLVHGPKHEVAVVRQLFSRFIEGKGKIGPLDLARWLNLRRIPTEEGTSWTRHKVWGILSNPKYTGRLVWGRTTQRLRTRTKPQPENTWAVHERAFKPIVDARSFAQAQQLLRQRSNRRIPEKALIAEMQRLLAKYRRLSEALVDERGAYKICTYRRHFGSLRRAYDVAGFRYPANVFANTAKTTKTCAVRDNVLRRLLSLFPRQMQAFRFRQATRRSNLLFRGRFKLYVWMARQYRSGRYGKRWRLMISQRENDGLTLLCLLDADNEAPESFYLFSAFDLRCWQYSFGPSDNLLSRGIRLEDLSQLCSAAEKTLIANAIPVPALDLSGLKKPLLQYQRSGGARDRLFAATPGERSRKQPRQ